MKLENAILKMFNKEHMCGGDILILNSCSESMC